jgi:uncharacterized cupredoxin-like copper-binding protein
MAYETCRVNHLLTSVGFEPSKIAARTGEPIEVVLVNEGFIPHDFTLAEGVSQPITIKADGRQTARGTFTLERPGTYTFFCSVNGHAQVRMRGTLTVE